MSRSARAIPARGQALVRNIRRNLLEEIDRISLELLHQAKNGFDAFARAPVQYWVNTANTGDLPNFEEFGFGDLPFLCSRGESLAAALRLRSFQPLHQWHALRLAHCRMDIDAYEMVGGEPLLDESDAIPSASEHYENTQRSRDELALMTPLPVQQAMAQFYDSREGDTFYPYAAPIALQSLDLQTAELNFVAEAFRRFGESLLITLDLRLDGRRNAVTSAEAAQLRHESSGVGFQILSAWLKSLGVLEPSHKCTICYRHTSAISRCSIHATKTHETAEARRGIRIRPYYQARLANYVSKRSFKRLVRYGLPWTDEAADELLSAATSSGLSASMQRRALVLANQLRDLLVAMNPEMQDVAERLFGALLRIASQLERLPHPASLQEQRARDRQRQEVKELLSIRGYFRAWCGSGRFSADADLTMLGFDRDHPVVTRRPISTQEVAWSFMCQRAWMDAAAEFIARTAPTAVDVEKLLDAGLDTKAISQRLGIARSTVYKILRRGSMPRRRQYLG